MSNTLIQVRVDSDLKEHADMVLKSMGLRTSEAIKMFLQQTINDQALPFKPNARKVPNAATLQAFDEVEKGEYTDLSLADFKKSLEDK